MPRGLHSDVLPRKAFSRQGTLATLHAQRRALAIFHFGSHSLISLRVDEGRFLGRLIVLVLVTLPEPPQYSTILVSQS